MSPEVLTSGAWCYHAARQNTHPTPMTRFCSMTLLVILGSLIAGGIWFGINGPYITGALTVFVAAYVAGLAVAMVFAVRSGSWRSIAAAGVLALVGFGAQHWAWRYTADPILAIGVLSLVVGLYFALMGRTRWELSIGALYLLGVLVAFLASQGIIPDHTERAPVFLAFSYPDLAALIGHLANVVLGVGAGDSGKRRRVWAAGRPAFLGGHASVVAMVRARLRGRAEGLASEATED